MYLVVISKKAQKKLTAMSVNHKTRVAGAIYMLGQDPEDVRLDIKPLVNFGDNVYRLRVGTWRVIFTIDDDIKIISIDRISSRGDVYK